MLLLRCRNLPIKMAMMTPSPIKRGISTAASVELPALRGKIATRLVEGTTSLKTLGGLSPTITDGKGPFFSLLSDTAFSDAAVHDMTVFAEAATCDGVGASFVVLLTTA